MKAGEIKLYPRNRFVTSGRVKPNRMDSINTTHEQKLVLEQLVLSIFADCTNGGLAFNDVLCAIYMSGLQHGSVIGEEIT